MGQEDKAVHRVGSKSFIEMSLTRQLKDITTKKTEGRFGLEKGLSKLEEPGIEKPVINRSPSLAREPLCLPILERFGFKFDSSGYLEDLDACIAPCIYWLYKLEGGRVSPSSILEIPAFYEVYPPVKSIYEGSNG